MIQKIVARGDLAKHPLYAAGRFVDRRGRGGGLIGEHASVIAEGQAETKDG